MSDRSQPGSRAEKGRLQVPGGSKHVSRIKPGCMPTQWGRPRADYAEAEGGVRTLPIPHGSAEESRAGGDGVS